MKYFFSFFSLFIGLIVSAQGDLNILFVDDSDDTFGNAETFANAIGDLGYSYIIYDAVADGSPAIQDMEPFDLVIWYTSSDGTDLALWNGNETDNVDLMGYLEGGGSVWLVGLDFLFDRYGSPPVQFATGDFVYDFLGLSSYDVQSYGDDGGLGVSQLSPAPQSPVLNSPEISFVFETLWWVDGVTLVDNAEPAYEMSGQAGYPLAEQICGLWYEGQFTSTLTYLFDMALVEEQARSTAILAALTFFEGQILSVSNRINHVDFQVFPNPSAGTFTVDLSALDFNPDLLRVFDMAGRLVWEERLVYSDYPDSGGVKSINLSGNIPAGIYQLQLSNGSLMAGARLVVYNR